MKRLLLLGVEFTDRNLSFVILRTLLNSIGGLCDVTKTSQKLLLLENWKVSCL